MRLQNSKNDLENSDLGIELSSIRVACPSLLLFRKLEVTVLLVFND